MKIGFQIRHFNPAKGGAETYIQRFAARLVQEGHEVHIFAQSAPEITAPMVHHAVNPYNPKNLLEAAKKFPVDVLVGSNDGLGMNLFQPHGGTYRRNMEQNNLLMRGLARSLRMWWKSVHSKTRAQVKLEEMQYSQQDPKPHYVAISNMVYADMQRFYQVPSERVHVIYNGVDTNAFSPEQTARFRESARKDWKIPDHAICFLFMAHNFKLKGLKQAIEALAQIPRSSLTAPKVALHVGPNAPKTPYPLIIVAGRGNAAQYRSLARSLRCADRVQFLGEAKHAVHAYAAADVFLLPTWYDPCSLSTLEALACGLPVITTKFNGASELMTGNEGIVIDTPANIPVLSPAIGALMDAARRKPMGVAARALAERYSLEKHFSEMMRIYEMVGKKAAAPVAAGRKRAKPERVG